MTSPPKVWDGVLRRLLDETPKLSLEAWIHPLTVQEDPERLVLLAPSAFHRERIRSHFASRIGCLASEVGGRPIEIAIEVAGRGEPASTAPARCELAAAALPAPSPALAAERTLKQLALPSTFDTFVTGPGNALAREASLAVAQGRQPGVFPLFLLGDSGIGKSHLARAVVAEARSSGVRALYASAERFTTEFTSSIRARQGNDFRRRYRQECDLLVIDDVQFLSGKGATQLELLHTVEHLRLVGARVVLTADRLPCRIPALSPRLASQMAGGLVAELELPDRALRREILRDKASRGGVALPPECLELLVDGVRGSVRDLEGALTQLVATASLLRRRIDRELTEQALRKLGGGAAREPQSLEVVLACVGGFFGVSRAQLASRSRARQLQQPRQLAMYLCRRYTDASLSEIGRVFSRNHPSVANAIVRTERAILERALLRYQVEELAARLEGRSERATRREPPGGRGDAPDRAPHGSDEAR